ncbi:MAG: hypothetical protein U5N26_10265 [Candidatus Marinimicrobia bacterium]|nr:hypothetical protein [Candidatus Neomarinimicrobiota bacterium]
MDNIITRITLPGAIMLALVAIMPYILMNIFNIDYISGQFLRRYLRYYSGRRCPRYPSTDRIRTSSRDTMTDS